MIANICDHRAFSHRWKSVNVVIEATWLDNGVKHSDQAPRGDYTYADRKGISLNEAIEWANTFEEPVTLFIYDASGIPADEASRAAPPACITKGFFSRLLERFR